MSDLKDSYAYHRAYGQPAALALQLARADVSMGKRRYPSSLVSPWNPRFAAYGENHLRWIESTDRAGLRFVGFADDIVSLRHTGWFIDEYQDEKYRGAVYQLAARKGESVFVYGYDDPNNPGAALLSFDWTADKEDAARWADSIAERAAEQEREYRAVYDARLAFDGAQIEAKKLRADALALIAEAKAKAPALADAPSIRAALCERVRAMRDRITDLYDERARLESDFGHVAGWRDA